MITVFRISRTWRRLARALEVPLYRLFYDGEEPPKLPNLPKRKASDGNLWGGTSKDARYLNKLRRVLSKTDEEHRNLVMFMVQKMGLSLASESLAYQVHYRTANSPPYLVRFAACGNGDSLSCFLILNDVLAGP